MAAINGILIFLVGGIIGFVICRLTLGKKQKVAQQQQEDKTKAEMDAYKSQVNQHFNSSAELMEQVANSYQALYTHMAGQSQVLLSETEADALPFPLLKTTPVKEPEAPEPEEDPEHEAMESIMEEVAKEDAEKETAETDAMEEVKDTVEKEDAAEADTFKERK